MADEPGFTIRVIVAGSVVDVETSADAARQNIEHSSKMPGSSLGHHVTPAELEDRTVLLHGLSLVASDVLLAGDEAIRMMQDVDGQWWSFRRSAIGAVCVIDHARTSKRLGIGFVLPAKQ